MKMKRILLVRVETIRVEGVAVGDIGPRQALASAAEQADVVLGNLRASVLQLTA